MDAEINAQRTEIESIVARVLVHLEQNGKNSSVSSPLRRREIPIEASARHVHLDAGALERLFGKGTDLRKKRDLSQPGEFLSEQRVKLVTSEGEIANVAVVGPLRPYVQVELSRSDCRILGLRSPLNVSGDLEGAADVFIIGERGMIEAKKSTIIAQSHVHLHAADADACELTNGDKVRVLVESERSLTFNSVIVRASDKFSPAVHIDFDEANACMLNEKSRAYLLYGASRTVMETCAEKNCTAPIQPETCCEEKVVTEAIARKLIAACRGNNILVRQGTILTPSARDVFWAAKKAVERIV